MQDLIGGVISGLVVNGISALFDQAWGARAKPRKQSSLLEPNLAKDREFLRALQDLEKGIHAQGGDAKRLKESLQTFLIRPEAQVLSRQLLALSLRGERTEDEIRSVKEEARRLFSMEPSISDADSRLLAQALVQVLEGATSTVVRLALGAEMVPQGELANRGSNVRLHEEISSIAKNIEVLTAIAGGPTLTEYSNYEESYRKQVAYVSETITPPNFDSDRKFPIDSIYVPPLLTQPGKESKAPESASKGSARPTRQQGRTLDLSEFVAAAHRFVILGNPGAGKSTLTRKVSHDLATGTLTCGDRKNSPTPLVVVLRDYGVATKEKPQSVIEYLCGVAKSNLQLPEPPAGFFDYLLVSGRAFVIFDGLDELIQAADRRAIAGAIDAFCTLYPSVPAIVTSRQVGYDQAPLDDRRFSTFILDPFDEDQVREYAEKWFALDAGLSMEQRTVRVDSFMRESEGIDDLRSNPLMLALLCNIYRIENYIPKYRNVVYRKCSEMLFERWDKGRGIVVELPFQRHVDSTMKFLAYWIYSEVELQSGVTESKLVEKATEYLCPKRYDDIDEARNAATEFVQFCRGRAWVFVEVGTTASGEGIYQFSHRTFLEYFAADYLVRTNSRPEDLWERLKEHVARGEWDQVAQLGVQIQCDQVEGAADTLMRLASEFGEAQTKPRKEQTFRFLARCLRFLVPSPSVCRRVVTLLVQFDLEQLGSRHRAGRQEELQVDRRERHRILADVLLASAENHVPVREVILESFARVIEGDDERRVAAAGELATGLTSLLFRADPWLSPRSSAYELSIRLTEQILKSGAERLRTRARADVNLCGALADEGIVTVPEMVGWHGVDTIYQFGEYDEIPAHMRAPLVDGILDVAFEWGGPGSGVRDSIVSTRLGQLRQVGELLGSVPLPWIRVGHTDRPRRLHWRSWTIQALFDEEENPTPRFVERKYDADEVRGFFCLLAPQIETAESRRRLVDRLDGLGFFQGVPLKLSLQSRYTRVSEKDLALELDSWAPDGAVRETVDAWRTTKMSFVSKAAIGGDGSRARTSPNEGVAP